jgi:Na+-transporting methylmalonyl-CoA/oxaloacetate decarboxylase gamma subunit
MTILFWIGMGFIALILLLLVLLAPVAFLLGASINLSVKPETTKAPAKGP